MKLEASIVSLGGWNSRIFTPVWVSENVFAMPDGESMNIALNEQQLSLVYIWKNIQLLLSDTRLELKSLQPTKATMLLMEQCYHRMASLLPYTPVTAIGFNLNLTLSSEEFKKTAVSGLVNRQTIGDYQSRAQTFTVSIGGSVRSVVVQINDDSAEIRVNFHYPQPNSIPEVGTAFVMVEKDIQQILGYELDIQ